jgi:hypothetical protein
LTDKLIPWAQATIEDAEAFDFTNPMPAVIEASAHAIGQLYAVEHAELQDNEAKESRVRVLAMLSAAMQMHAQLGLPKCPYGPMMQLDERRTAVPDDWQGADVAVLERLGQRATNPVIRARLLDVAWFLERKRVQAGHDAAAAYLAIAKGLCDGTLADSTDAKHPGITALTMRDALQRGLQICAQLRPGEPEAGEFATFVLEAADGFEKAEQRDGLLPMLTLAYDFELGDSEACASRLEKLAEGWTERDPHVQSDTFVLAAKAWHQAKSVEGKERCLMRASEILAAHAGAIQQAFHASHWIQQAIDLLRGLRSMQAKERKRDLRIELIRKQAGIDDEMALFEQPIDLTEAIEEVTAQMEGISLFDGIFFLANVTRSPEPDTLEEEARKVIAQNPLSAMFALQQHDTDGHVRFRAPGALPGQALPEILEHRISQSESMSRSLIVEGQINVVIRNLAMHYPIVEDDLFLLCRESPFVPTDLTRTYARGLTAFLHGNMTVALSVLTPLLEASLVYVLKGHGIDVVRHDQEAGTQEDMSITQLFQNFRDNLNSIFGKAIVDDIERVFLSRSGPGLRHAVAHGTMNDRTPYSSDARYACWFMLHLALLPLFPRYAELRATVGERLQCHGVSS